MNNHHRFSRTAIVIALSAVFPVAGAMADEVDDLINPNVAEVTFKLPYQNEIHPLYRQYNGVNHKGINGNIDIDIVRRGEEGDWLKVQGRELGLSTQEFGASYEKQGDWSVALEYNQIPRYSPYEVTTGVGGIGTNSIVQPALANSAFTNGRLSNPALGSVTLSTERDITTLSASKYLMEGLKLGFSFKNEDKTGTRMDGVRGVAGNYGTAGGSANLYSGFLFAAEPVNQNHQQFEGTLEYVSKKFQLTAGYYGSFLSTRNNSLYVLGGTNTAAVTANLSPIALAPDNSLNQFYLNGAYNFTKDTRATFKVAYSEGRQNEQFMTGQATNAAGIGNGLDGKIQTTEFYGALTSRLTKDLKILASWRYEDKQDKTPLRDYRGSVAYSSFTFNNPESHTANWGKLEADYLLGQGYGLTAGVDYTNKSRMDWVGITNNAANGYQNPEYDYGRAMHEVTTRLALRKSMSETVNGSLSYARSDRKNDNERWTATTTAPPMYPVYLADRNRDKLRGMIDWAATEQLNLQVAYEAYFDRYDMSAYGLEKGNGQVFSIDGSYAINDNWKLSSWYSRQVGETNQVTQGAVCSTTNNSNCTANTARAGVPLVQWNALLKLNSDQFGFGLAGKVKALELGAQYLYSSDKNRQDISDMPATTLTAVGTPRSVASGMGVLPDTKYTQNTFKLFGAYPVAKMTKLRLDYIHDQRKMDDYTWQNWVYADGTKVYVKPSQTVQILGISITQSF